MRRGMVLLLLAAWSAMALADEPRTVTVQGTGSVQYEPDRASLQVAINVRSKEISQAQRRVADVSNAVLAVTERHGVERQNVDTTRGSLRPDYQWTKDNEQVLRGYIANRDIRIELRDLDRLGDLLEALVASGVNSVSEPALYATNKEALQKQALAAAAVNARGKAEVLAQTLGASLGDVVRIEAVSQPPVVAYRAARSVAAESDAGESYQPGERTFSAQVSAVFALTD